MSLKKCPECGGNILVDYKTPTKTFSISNNNNIQLKRVDQNITTCPDGDNAYLDFKCENNSEHNIGTDEIMHWIDEVDKVFYDEGYHE